MIYATMQRSPQTRSKSCYGATIPQLVPIAVVKFKPSYSNADICQLFGISELELTRLRLDLFESGQLTPGHHYWQSRDGIRWSESALWRLTYHLDSSPLIANPGSKPIALLPPAKPEFSLSSKQIADAVGISVSRLHRIRRGEAALIQGEHYQQIKTATNTIAYQWSELGLTIVRSLVGGGANV
jgi:hypothetical protein